MSNKLQFLPILDTNPGPKLGTLFNDSTKTANPPAEDAFEQRRVGHVVADFVDEVQPAHHVPFGDAFPHTHVGGPVKVLGRHVGLHQVAELFRVRNLAA